MKKITLLLAVLLVFSNVKASHFMGGEITWVCIKDVSNPDVGKYIFTMKIYQDCDGIDFPFTSQSLTVHNNPSLTTILVNFVASLLKIFALGLPALLIPPVVLFPFHHIYHF